METLSQNNTVKIYIASTSVNQVELMLEIKRLARKVYSASDSIFNDGTACAELLIKLKETKYHRTLSLTFEQFMDGFLRGGHDLYSRYKKVVEVQRFLKANNLPPILEEEQARIIARRIKDDPETVAKLRDLVFADQLPNPKIMKAQLPAPKKAKKTAGEKAALKAGVGLVAKKKKSATAACLDQNGDILQESARACDPAISSKTCPGGGASSFDLKAFLKGAGLA